MLSNLCHLSKPLCIMRLEYAYLVPASLFPVCLQYVNVALYRSVLWRWCRRCGEESNFSARDDFISQYLARPSHKPFTRYDDVPIHANFVETEIRSRFCAPSVRFLLLTDRGCAGRYGHLLLCAHAAKFVSVPLSLSLSLSDSLSLSLSLCLKATHTKIHYDNYVGVSYKMGCVKITMFGLVGCNTVWTCR
jgi:hypothetical protein